MLNEHFQFRRLNYFKIDLAEKFWRIYAIDAPHSVCPFIELVRSAHLFDTLERMFAIQAGKRVTQLNGILSNTNEWKLCLLKVGPPCFFWVVPLGGSICTLAIPFFCFYERLMLARVELCED